jgi:hypothetical protein
MAPFAADRLWFGHTSAGVTSKAFRANRPVEVEMAIPLKAWRHTKLFRLFEPGDGRLEPAISNSHGKARADFTRSDAKSRWIRRGQLVAVDRMTNSINTKDG